MSVESEPAKGRYDMNMPGLTAEASLSVASQGYHVSRRVMSPMDSRAIRTQLGWLLDGEVTSLEHGTMCPGRQIWTSARRA